MPLRPDLRVALAQGAYHLIIGDDRSPDNHSISEDDFPATHIIYEGSPCQNTGIFPSGDSLTQHVPHTQKSEYQTDLQTYNSLLPIFPPAHNKPHYHCG